MPTNITYSQIAYHWGILSVAPVAPADWDAYVDDGSGANPAGFYIYDPTVAGGTGAWVRQNALTYGVLSVAPAIPAGSLPGDTYYDDGLGANPEGLYIVDGTMAWVLISAPGVASLDVNSSGTPLTGAIDLLDGTNITLTNAAPNITAEDSTLPDLEKAEKYHDVLQVGQAANNALPTQRCIARADNIEHGFYFHMFHDGVNLHLVADNQADTNPASGSHPTFYQRTVWEYIIQMQTVALAPLAPDPADFCLVSEGAYNMLHLFFIAVDPIGGNRRPWDCYFDPGAALPMPPIPGTASTIVLTAEPVDNNLLGTDCYAVSATRVPNNGANHVVAVWMQNDGGGVSNIHFNYYNNTAPAYTRYDHADVVISNPVNNARYPTVEASEENFPASNMIHVAYIESIAGAWRLMYAARLMMVWSASPAPVDSYGAFTIDSDTGYPSMVAFHNATAGRMEVVVAIQNTDAGANDEIYAYHFTPDMCAGVPTFYAASSVDMYDDFHPNNHPLCAYQLGISQTDQGTSTPIFFLYKAVMTATAQNYDVVLAYASFPPCSTMPWPTITLRSGIGNFSANNTTLIRPKCHYQYSGPRRGWRPDNVTPWYPVAHHARHAKMFVAGAAVILHERVLCVKDVPDYPLTLGVGM